MYFPTQNNCLLCPDCPSNTVAITEPEYQQYIYPSNIDQYNIDQYNNYQSCSNGNIYNPETSTCISCPGCRSDGLIAISSSTYQQDIAPAQSYLLYSLPSTNYNSWQNTDQMFSNLAAGCTGSAAKSLGLDMSYPLLQDYTTQIQNFTLPSGSSITLPTGIILPAGTILPLETILPMGTIVNATLVAGRHILNNNEIPYCILPEKEAISFCNIWNQSNTGPDNECIGYLSSTSTNWPYPGQVQLIQNYPNVNSSTDMKSFYQNPNYLTPQSRICPSGQSWASTTQTCTSTNY